MCGIIAVVRRASTRRPPSPDELRPLVLGAADRLMAAGPDPVALAAVATDLETADVLLRGVPGVRTLLAAPDLTAGIDAAAERIWVEVARIEGLLDTGVGDRLEAVNAALLRIKDAAWAIQRDRLRNARLVGELAGPAASAAAVAGCTSIQVALSALDRLEVRGRDSAGVHLLVRDHGLDLDDVGVRALLDARVGDPLFRSGAARTPAGHLSLIYKAAAEIGELGDNAAAIRAAIAADEVLHLALRSPTAEVVVVAHTRWASVGIISEANAHPLNSDEPGDGAVGPYVIGALNGDVDNHADLKALHSLRLAAEITTDAKVIPTLVSRRLAAGDDALEAFRSTVAGFEGSVAIAAQAADDPDRVLLALRGSGQALYVGLAEECFLVASEPYGLVEETPRYLRMDGETPADAENPNASRGQVIALDARRAGDLDGIERLAYDGTPLPVTEADVVTAQITTRDIDRGANPHFLIKEIGEAPGSFRKTLRGKLVGDRVQLGDDAMPASVRERLASGELNRVVAIGQGTAAVAAQSLVSLLGSFVADTPLRVESLPATELSGFGMRPDMSDTLVVAISQSGTTTDTNRTVDLARSRGAAVLAIVNRRNSDLTDKADGVLYTSDGRDVEMAVPSTKAFYAQVAAGCLLAVAVADAVGADALGAAERTALLTALRELPDAMASVLEQREAIGRIATEVAPSRRNWAIVGNGPNRIAAQELRIKLSELCYKSIACDVTEDKKHIDLSAEPLILVCAAGLTGSTADDVAKEVAIYRAHKAAPIVIGTEGEGRFGAALQFIGVPATHPQLAFVLSAMAGHLFGYEAALAIDHQAQPLRAARAAIEGRLSAGLAGGVGGEAVLASLRPQLSVPASTFFDGLRSGEYDGHLEASTAVRLASTFRYALGIAPLDAYQTEHGKVGTPGVVVDDLTASLTQAIEELTRPIDAIKHQAKTVTVGISRTDETLLQVPLVGAVLAAGAPRDSLTYRTLKTLADLDPAVAEVTGFIRYRVEGDPSIDGDALAVVVDRGGVALGIPSRSERDPVLAGTKHTVAMERELYVARGRRDGRTIVIVPEVKDGHTTAITLLHVRFHDRLPASAARSVMQGYRGRFAALRDAVCETEPAFREDVLASQPVVDLLCEAIQPLADRWRV